MNTIKNVFLLGIGVKLFSVIGRKLIYKFFLRKSIQKNNLKVIFNNLEIHK